MRVPAAYYRRRVQALRRGPTALIVALTFLAGFAAAVLLDGRVPRSWAQDPAPGLRECFAAKTWMVSGRQLNGGKLPDKMLKIPPGWTVVGGSSFGQHGEGVVILCR